LNFQNLLLKEETTALSIKNLADTERRDLRARNWYCYDSMVFYVSSGKIRTFFNTAADKIDFQARDIAASAYETVATMQSHATQPYFEILASGSLVPHTTKSPSLGSVSKYWNQAFIDAIICSDSIDLDPTAGDAVIYFNHDGAANEASLRYDKVNKRLELWIDGAIVGYCNAALGWVNGPP